MITKENVETLLDTGQLEIRMSSGRYWAIRRNGKTRRWKRDPDRFEIPFKAGFRTYGTITNENLETLGLRIKEND